MNGLSFRDASDNDIDIFISIMQENYPDPKDRHWDKILYNDFKDVLSKKYVSKFIIVLLDNIILGFGCYMILRADMYKLSWINIMPAYKKQGIGTELVKKLEADILKVIPRGIKLKNVNIVLETDKPVFYNKIGYTAFKVQETNCFMSKVLPI